MVPQLRIAINSRIVAVLAAVSAIAMLSAVGLAANFDTVEVSVTIGATTDLVVQPIAVNFGTVSVGTNSSTSILDIKNAGSTDLTNVFANVTVESTNPLGTSVATNYNTSSFAMIRNETHNQFFWAGRAEWNLSQLPLGLSGETLNLGSGVTRWGRGWYRLPSGNWYVWKVENGTSASTMGHCNSSSATFTIKKVDFPENSSIISRAVLNSVRDLSTGVDTFTSPTVGTGSSIGKATFAINSGVLNGYCVTVNATCEYITIHKFSRGDSMLPACSQQAYLVDGTIAPGNIHQMSILASIPQGIPDGAAGTGTLMVVGTAA